MAVSNEAFRITKDRHDAMEQALQAIRKICGGIRMGDVAAHECLAECGSLAGLALDIHRVAGIDKVFSQEIARLAAN